MRDAGLVRSPSALSLACLATLATLVVSLFVALLLCACAAGGGNARVTVPVREAVNDYSWDELASLSAEIAAARNDESALATAKRYHLTTGEGKLDGSQYKEVELASGATTRVLIAGFNHDERPGGSKAGITFVFADAVALRGMNNNAGFDETSKADDFDAVGGWNACELRGWLNDEFVNELPADLRAHLANVVKTSLVVPKDRKLLDGTDTLLSSVDSLIGQGTDTLWIPALVELSGVKGNSAIAKERPEWTAPLRAEGSQYQLFADVGVSEQKPNEVLVRHFAGEGDSCGWWMRSLEEWTFSSVDFDGMVNRRGGSDQLASLPKGVVPCFAL